MGHYSLVDLHALVDAKLSVTAAHQAGHRVRDAIMQELPQVNEVFVHVEADLDGSAMDDDLFDHGGVSA